MERDTMRSSPIISVILSILLILLSPLPIYSDQAKGKSFNVGIISPNAKMQNIVDGFKSGMESSGFTEGKDYRHHNP